MLTDLIANCSDERLLMDYLFYQAKAHFRNKDFAEARRCVAQMLRIQPQNRQALALERLATEHVKIGISFYMVCG